MSKPLIHEKTTLKMMQREAPLIYPIRTIRRGIARNEPISKGSAQETRPHLRLG